jgi:FMN phosphatase YigB (HAD superfamily)
MVFDIGGVLVDWDPALAFEEACGGRAEAEAFMERTGFRAKNTRGDRGERFADMPQENDEPADRALFETYVPNYARTVANRIEGTWALLDRMKAAGVPVHAITNWSAETWPQGLLSQPRLGEVFDTLVISGQVGMMKPHRAIFDLFCERAGVTPEQCFFTDDGMHNVDGAIAAGLQAAQFTSPEQLERDLIERGLL